MFTRGMKGEGGTPLSIINVSTARQYNEKEKRGKAVIASFLSGVSFLFPSSKPDATSDLIRSVDTNEKKKKKQGFGYIQLP